MRTGSCSDCLQGEEPVTPPGAPGADVKGPTWGQGELPDKGPVHGLWVQEEPLGQEVSENGEQRVKDGPPESVS